MKKQNITILILLFHLLVFATQAQKLEATEVGYKLSKEALKAKKAGALISAGTYWNDDKTQLYQIYAFTPKKSNTIMAEIVTVEENGSVKSSETVALTDSNLSKYNLVDLEAASEDSRKNLENLPVGFIRNPALAGTPKILKGTLVDRYQSTNAGSIWVGYKFKKDNDLDLADKFWSFVSFPIGDQVIAKNDHLIAATSTMGKAIQGFGTRQYFNAEGKAYVGGLKATMGANIFLSGILNISDGSWESKQDIDVGMKLLADPTSSKFYRHSNGNTSVLLSSGASKEYKLLYLDEKGAKIKLSQLANPRSGGKVGTIPSTLLAKAGDQLYAATATYETVNGKTVGISVSPIKEGTPLSNWTFTNDQLAAKVVQPAKQKLKIEKLKFYTLQSMRQLKNGDLLINGYARYERSNSVDRVFLATQISATGVLKAAYLLGAIKLGKDEKFAQEHAATHGHIAPTIKETNNGFFWVERAVLKGYEKGVHTWSEDRGYATRYNAVRVDDTYALGQVVKVNTSKMTLSNVVTIEDQILGDRIGDLSKAGHLALFSGSGLQIIK